MLKLPELSAVLEYKNASVISQFCIEHPDITPTQAEQIFQDLLAWLWLSVNRIQRQLTTHMIAPLTLLDNMWHNFILHTKSYTEFCEHYFNQYLHHEVEKVGFEFTPSTDELSEFLSDCYDYLGEAWICRYFSL